MCSGLVRLACRAAPARCIIRTEVEFVRKYVLKRILISIVILFFVSFIIYGLMRCLPTSYVERMATAEGHGARLQEL